MQQRTQSADLLCKTQVIHHFKFCCAYKIVKKRCFQMRLEKHGSQQVIEDLLITKTNCTKVSQSEKVFNQQFFMRYLKGTEIPLTKLLQTPRLILSTITSSRAKMTWKVHGKKSCKQQMLIKDLQPFQQWSNMKNISLITEQKFLRALINSFAL